MSGSSKVFVVDPDPRAGRQMLLGFSREGIAATAPAISDDDAVALDAGAPPALVLVGGADGRALSLVRRTRALLADARVDVPLVFAGRGVARDDALAAGADEVVARPAYLRDVVTIARIMLGVRAAQRDHLVGNLVETTGVYVLARALAALARSGVLTLIRGLRRGEIRFFHGEVTSAEVGLIHGQAAFHQLLLWTDARYDFQTEDIVRRHQIPLPSDELFADAERFLEGVREHAGGLSPATVLEQNVQRIHDVGTKIPTEVHGVLRMFDGHRVLADILQDSPYRVFETLRVASKAVEGGLLKETSSQRPKATWKTVLAIEEWLVGSETREAVVERTAKIADTGPTGLKKTGGKKKRKKKRAATPAPVPAVPPSEPARADFDWTVLVPRVVGAEVGPLSGVVPASATAGEIDVPSRVVSREGLEALMDTDKRQRIFPTDIGLEPSIVIGDASTPVTNEQRAPIPRAVTAEPEASDGIPQDAIATADTGPSSASAKPVAPEPAPAPAPKPTPESAPAPAPEPTPESAPAPEPEPTPAPAPTPELPREPSLLVDDLAAAHAAIAKVTAAQASAAPTADASSPAADRAVADVAHDAAAFSDDEEAFFAAAARKSQPHLKVESFEDLDEGYQPVGFWDRVLGRRGPKDPKAPSK